MAGGKGTRLSSITKNRIPKPMVLIDGKPLLQWQVERLRDNGITRILIVIGFLGYHIREYFQDGSKYGVHITYFVEKEPLGTAGAFYEIEEKLEEEFFLVFGDVLFDVDFMRMKKFHAEKKADVTLLVHPNTHPADSDLVDINDEERVVKFHFKNGNRDEWYRNCVNAGLYILSKVIFKQISRKEKMDLEKDVLAGLCAQGSAVYAYRSSEYVKDVGTPKRMSEALGEIKDGYMEARNLHRMQKAIFFDGDSIWNAIRGLEYSSEELELEESVARAVRMINKSEFLVIIVVSQSYFFNELCSLQKIKRIYRKMEMLLGKSGAYVDDIFFCSKNSNKETPLEDSVCKVDFQYQKLKPLEESVKKYNIDKKKSWIVGNTMQDMQMGKDVGIKTAYVKQGVVEDKVIADWKGENILSAVQQILKVH